MGFVPLRRLLLATTVLPTAVAFWLSTSKLLSVRLSYCAGATSTRGFIVRRWQSNSMAWTACPSCRGNGKISRAPTKKARLRQKRAKLDTPAIPLPPRLEPCKKCNQTGLVESTGDFSTTLGYPRVAIIGGGLGGLALGIACSHRGIPFQIYERDTSFLMRKQGYGLTLQQASRALASFGIQSLKEGVTSTRHVVHTVDGNAVGEWGLRKWGRDETKRPPKRQNVHIARQALRRELLDALGGEQNVSWGHKLVGMTETANCMELDFETEGGSNIHHKADLVVGADGIRSAVRQLLFEPETSTAMTPLRYLGCIVVLGICPLSTLKDVTRESELLDGHTVFQTADGSTRIYLMPYSSTEYMWQLSFPMEDEEMAKDLSRRGPGALKEEALSKCGSWHSPIPDILRKTSIELVSGYPVYDRDLICTSMLNTRRRVTLLGDAAHPMSPFKGQGANQAMLDALSLARCLYSTTSSITTSTTATTTNITEPALKAYHSEMVDRSAKKVQASAQAAQFLHTSVAIQEGNVTRGAAASTTSTNPTIQ